MAERLVANYYVYRATLSVGFVTPVFTLFLLRTLSFPQVGVLSALYSAVVVLGEVPTGYVGDRLGRRASLLLSVVFSVVSLGGFVVAESFAWFVVLYVLWGLALTFRSGSLDAWLYDLLDERLDADAFTRVRGRGDAVQQWTSAVTMVAGGALYGLDPTSPFVAAVAFNSLGVLALFRLPKSARYTDGEERPPMREILGVVRERLTRPPLRALVVYAGLLFAATGVARGYVQPMAVETLGPTAATLGVDLPAGGAVAAARSGEAGATLGLGLGVLYAALSVVSSVGGYYAGPLADRLGVRGTLLVVPPVVGGYLNDHVEGVGRATTLSAAAMCYGALRTPLALGAGVLAGATTATTAVAAMGGVVLVGGGAVWLLGDVAPDTRVGRESGAGGEAAGED
jgi:predicted MFS family arabinose efflux permease